MLECLTQLMVQQMDIPELNPEPNNSIILLDQAQAWLTVWSLGEVKQEARQRQTR